MRKSVWIIALALAALTLVSCAKGAAGLVDGYYTAESSAFDSHGWKEYVTICVNGGKIATVEYNAVNPSGMVKAWDMNYMRIMNRVSHSYPNQYTRAYGGDLLRNQNADGIQAISGATHSYGTFEKLAAAVLKLAQKGQVPIARIDTGEE